MSELRFDDKVAVVTGAGRGIGRAHALLLASRGAKVVVNDLGIEVDGTGASSGPADAVVAEIRAAGGVAVANPNSVADREGAEGVVDQALEEFGGLDILIHNAGFNLGPFEAILDVHLRAAYWLTERAWPTMMAQKSGRIILTTSAAGLYGDGTGPEFNPKQAYSTAKMALVGMTKALAMRGRPVNINANALSPTGDTRLVGLNKGITNTREGAPPPEATINWVARTRRSGEGGRRHRVVRPRRLPGDRTGAGGRRRPGRRGVHRRHRGLHQPGHHARGRARQREGRV